MDQTPSDNTHVPAQRLDGRTTPGASSSRQGSVRPYREVSADATGKPTPLRVLVVDDERLLAWSIVETLRDAGCEARSVGDAASALREVASPARWTDVVILDVYLPDSDNLGVLAAMRRLAPQMPVILMTAHGSPALIERARSLGAFTVLDKPFELSNLLALVEGARAGGVD